MKKLLVLLCAVITVFAAVDNAMGLPVVFEGKDPGVAPGGVRPNSDTAADAFDLAASALGGVNMIDFEDQPLGNFSSLEVAPGVTTTLTGTSSQVSGGITADADTVFGYNTTAAGRQHLRITPEWDVGTATVGFSFDNAISAFGLYLTGLEPDVNGDLSAVFDDGSVQNIAIDGGSDGGGVQFFGFTDAGASITNIELQLSGVSGSRDIFGIDDVRYVNVVPEPGTMLLLGSGLIGLAALGKKKFSKK